MTEEHYDPFPINLLESSGDIKREDFTFKTRRVRIYHKQEFTEYRICGKISGVIKDEKMFIKLQDINMPEYINNEFSFREISLNKDRILWSNLLMMGGYSNSPQTPSFLSMFYQNRFLKKIQFSNQTYAIEFYTT